MVVIPSGWGARQLEAAYKLPVSRRSHQTVAVSIAFDTPRLEQFLAVYRKHFGAAAVHHRQRMLPQGQPARPGPPAAVGGKADIVRVTRTDSVEVKAWAA